MKRTVSSEFSKCFNGNVILDNDIESKLNKKHKVYKDDLSDALGDPYSVVMKTKKNHLTQKISLNPLEKSRWQSLYNNCLLG